MEPKDKLFVAILPSNVTESVVVEARDCCYHNALCVRRGQCRFWYTRNGAGADTIPPDVDSVKAYID